MSDEELRLIAIGMAVEAEGPKATTAEILQAAQEIYDWLRSCAAGQRPN